MESKVHPSQIFSSTNKSQMTMSAGAKTLLHSRKMALLAHLKMWIPKLGRYLSFIFRYLYLTLYHRVSLIMHLNSQSHGQLRTNFFYEECSKMRRNYKLNEEVRPLQSHF